MSAIGFFIYQSLDAIDGKQARRTGTNTPLGELFDHGCDAISGFTVLFSALSAVGTHDFPLLMLGFSLLLIVLTYCYHWQTYVSGILYFKKYATVDFASLEPSVTGSVWLVLVIAEDNKPYASC
jgi:phosphatidylglycerophosphate synthase